MSHPDYDVIIVGARVAGSILATALGEGGVRVLLLDRARFPSDTLSTHFFRAPALRAFQRIGVLEEVQSAAPHLTIDHNVIDGIAFPEPVDGPEDFPYYLCLRRLVLDEILLRRARATGVEVREGAKGEELLWAGRRCSGVAWRETTGRAQATAGAVIGADGLNSFVAKHAGAVAEHEEPIRRAMYYAYYRGVEPMPGPAAEFHFLGNTLVYSFPCDEGLTLLAASVPLADFREFKRDPEGRLQSVLEGMVGLVDRLGRAERVGAVRGTGSIPGRLRIPYGDGWALVGDAGMVMDPWSGQGIDQASTHALFLAAALSGVLGEAVDWGTAMGEYHRQRNEFSRTAYDRTCAQGRDLRPMTRAALRRRGLI